MQAMMQLSSDQNVVCGTATAGQLESRMDGIAMGQQQAKKRKGSAALQQQQQQLQQKLGPLFSASVNQQLFQQPQQGRPQQQHGQVSTITFTWHHIQVSNHFAASSACRRDQQRHWRAFLVRGGGNRRSGAGRKCARILTDRSEKFSPTFPLSIASEFPCKNHFWTSSPFLFPSSPV
jgi:hypothetical protein